MMRFLATKLLQPKLLSSFPTIAINTVTVFQEKVHQKKTNSFHNVRFCSQTRWLSDGVDRGGLGTGATYEICDTKVSPRKKIAVAMSGGVDSSVVAYLLAQQYPVEELIGIHMSNWDYADEDPTATTMVQKNEHDSYCWEQDWKDASAVSTQLNIPIHHVSFQADYWNLVFQPYCQNLSRSITPNPDVDCNRYIKFGALKEYLKSHFDEDIGCLATGHYARIWDRSRTSDGHMEHMPKYLREAFEAEESPALADYILHPSVADSPLLMSARDRSKDQSYFLSGVPAEALSGVLFPLGDYYKTDQGQSFEGISGDNGDGFSDDDSALSVRQIAQHARLPNATKKDSVGICFIGKRKHGNFINEYVDHPLDDRNGGDASSPTSSLVRYINIENQEVISTFDPIDNPSLLYATIGQGAKISGAKQKWFVVDKQLQPPRRADSKAERTWRSPCIMVCPGTHHPSLYVNTFFVKSKNFNWIAGGKANSPPPLPFHAKCRIRHLQPLVDCEIVMTNDHHESIHASSEKTVFDDRTLEIKLKTPMRGIAPGQVCAVYAGGEDGDLICLGGGPVHKTGKSYWDMQQNLPETLHPSGHNDSSIVKKKLGS